jgi:D-2-hydroxyacid dehydrogenase (NADP+)
MDTINVLVLAPVPEKCLQQIREIDPRIKVTDATAAIGISNPFEQFGPDSVAWERLRALLSDTEVLFSFRVFPDLQTVAPKLRWVQTLSAGVERVLTPEMVNSRIILTNARGMHVVQIGEMVFNLILMHAKGSVDALRYQGNKKWEHYAPTLLAGKTLGIAGLGSIGKRLAYLGKAFDMKVVATRRSIKRVSRACNVDVLYPRDQLNQLLAESDFVVNALPSTPETLKLFGEKEFHQMKPSSFFVNIGRGTTVDEEAMIRALKEKRIAGAGLDTFAREPLPPGSPLWEIPGVIITPHIAGAVSDYVERATNIFCENLKRYLNGERLINVVNKKRGY